MRRRPTRRFDALAPFVALTAATAVCGLAIAQQPQEWSASTCLEAKVAELGSSESLFGRRLFVDAKVLVVSGNELVLRDATEVTFLVEGQVLALLGSLREGSNVRVFGLLGREPAGRKVFTVYALELRPDDAILFRDELARLAAAADRPGLLRLAERVEHEVKRSKNEALQSVVENAYRAAVAIDEKAARPQDTAAALQIAEEYRTWLGDRQTALAWVLRVLKPGEPVPAEAERLLRALNAVPYGRGEWILYEEMKKREGFVLRDGVWVLAARAAFLDVIERQLRERKKPRIGSLPDYFAEVAKAHQVVLGMTKREVAQSIGFPDEVDRIRRGTSVFEAWIYESRGTFYFEDGILFLTP